MKVGIQKDIGDVAHKTQKINKGTGIYRKGNGIRSFTTKRPEAKISLPETVHGLSENLICGILLLIKWFINKIYKLKSEQNQYLNLCFHLNPSLGLF